MPLLIIWSNFTQLEKNLSNYYALSFPFIPCSEKPLFLKWETEFNSHRNETKKGLEACPRLPQHHSWADTLVLVRNLNTQWHHHPDDFELLHNTPTLQNHLRNFIQIFYCQGGRKDFKGIHFVYSWFIFRN